MEDDSQLVEEAVIAPVFTAAQYYPCHHDKKAHRTSTLSGHMYIQELLYHGHTSNIQNVFRMPPYTLRKLQNWLFDHTDLAPTRLIGIAEKLAIFIGAAGYGLSNEYLCDRFQHSDETISRCDHEVVNIIGTTMAPSMVPVLRDT